jgi:hypothetical protein
VNARLPGAIGIRLEHALVVGVVAAAAWLALAETGARRAEQAWRWQLAQSEELIPMEAGASLPASEQGERWRKQKEAQADRWEQALGRDAVMTRRLPPQGGADAYFALAQRVEEMKSQLGAAGVETREAERFTFASYRFSGPPAEHVATVVHQQEKVACLVDAVGHARARALIRIEREAGGAERAERLVSEDFFVPSDEFRLPLPAEWNQLLFRVAFIGETATLRQFLERFSDRAPDGFVRWVEVRPWGDASPGPVVAPFLTAPPLQFVVTVAFLEWPRADGGDRESGS